ncbi:long-chain acyl-CoA synthetase [Sphingobium francense]|nr:long-chain acyl-CoA synthetase [Sphingobium indicum]
MASEIVSGDRSISREAMLGRAAQAASGLRSLGVGVEDTVALILRNDIAFLEASFAVGLLGACPVAVNWHFSVAEAAYVIDDCRARAVIIHADLHARLADAIPASVPVIIVDTPPEIAAAYDLGKVDPPAADALRWDSWLTGFAPVQAAVTSPGTIIYTSGTTGNPKGVRRSRPTAEQARITNAIIAGAYGLDASDTGVVSLIAAPMYHSAPNAQALFSVQIGATVILQPRFDPEGLLALIEKWRVTHIYLAPIMFNRLLQLPASVRERYDVSSLRFVVHAAAPCPQHVKRQMIEWWGPIIREFYGSTEVRAIAICTSQEWLERPGTVGRAIPGAEMKICDAQGRVLPPGEIGELVCGFPTASDFSYQGDEEKRRSVDRGGLIATGDVGYIDEDGYLFICDRSNDMIISGGVNIYPAEIEAALARVPGVRDSAVFGIPDEEYGESVMAVVQPVEGRTLTPEGLAEALRKEIASYKIPRRIELADDLPREDSGKIFKRKLRAPFWEKAGRQI